MRRYSTAASSHAISLAPHEVLVRVAASSVNALDVMQSRRGYGRSLPLRGPGRDLVGTIESVGEAAWKWSRGDRVFGVTPLIKSTYVDQSADDSLFAFAARGEPVRVDASSLVHLPEHLRAVEAATIPYALITAFASLRQVTLDLSGQTVAILGATGGVGTLAVQLAKSLGAFSVIAVIRKCPGRDEKSVASRLISLGASRVAVALEDIEESLNGHPLPFLREWGSYITLNSPLVRTSDLANLAHCGLVHGSLIGVNQAFNALVNHRTRLHYGLYQPSLFAMETMEDVCWRRAVMPVVDRVFPIEDLESAYSYFEETRGIFGKVAIDVTSEAFEEARSA